MTLALALNATLGNQSQLNLSDAIEATMFDGTSVSFKIIAQQIVNAMLCHFRAM